MPDTTKPQPGSITTRTGDAGRTRLFSGEAVSKYAPRPSTYGDLDELVSQLGVARLHLRDDNACEAILAIQRQLFTAGSEIATTDRALQRLPARIDAAAVDQLDRLCADYEGRLGPWQGFVVPAATLAAAHLDVARTIARRVERGIVRLYDQGDIRNPELLRWFNRLSDLLYLLARCAEDEPILLDPKP